MWSKLYLAALGFSLVVMAFFTYYSWSWLQSIGRPSVAVAGFEYHSGLAWTTLWISSFILLILGNAILWTIRRAWAMWATFVYFAVMIASKFFWLDRAYFQFKTDNGLLADGFSTGSFFAVIIIAIMAAIVFFDQFILVRLHGKMYQPIVIEPEAPAKAEVE